MREAIDATGAVAVGPYSHAMRVGDLVLCSGQTPLDPATGELVTGGIAAQTTQCFANLFAVLEAAGLGPEDVVKANVYLTDMATFAEMNTSYEAHFAEPYPARTTIGVASLPLGAAVEIELIANRTRRATGTAADSAQSSLALDAVQVRAKSRDFVLGLRGYARDEVVEFLDRLAAAVQVLDAGDAPLPDDLHPVAIRSKEFQIVWRGFDRDEVRAYLEHVATELAAATRQS